MLSDYTPTSKYYAEIIGDIGSEYNSNLQAQAQAQGKHVPIAKVVVNQEVTSCEGNCTGTCSGTCSGSCSDTCSGTCSNTCSDTCKGACKSTCTNDCSANCKGDCKTACTGSCSDGCTGSCSDGCKGSCKGECTGICEKKCEKCQTYCENEQTYVKNKKAGGESFSWSSTVSEGAVINISARDWNKLADYVNAAAELCTSDYFTELPTNVKPGSYITASAFNNMAIGVNAISSGGHIGYNKKPNVSKIAASDFKALASHYNSAEILSNLKCCQLGQVKEKDFGSKQPCKEGQTCKNGQTCKEGQVCTQQNQLGTQVGSPT